MTLFTDLLAASQLGDDSCTYAISEDWMQGRAIYGGLSTALCLDACLKCYPDLPPLRSANVNFVGPASEELSVIVKVLRRGKSVAFVEAQLQGEAGLVTSAVFSFGAGRESSLPR